MNITEEHQIEMNRMQTVYDDAIKRQTDSIKRQYRIEAQRLIAQMDEDINRAQCERRDAMFKEMEKLKESWSDDE